MFYVVLVFCSIVCGGGAVTCPTTQSVERMGNKTIACSADGVIERCFWYLGSNTKTPPILYYEMTSRVKGGTRLSDDNYDITSECGMRIINAQIIHEGNYTFLAFFKNGTDWQQVISILVTVTPSQLHPVITTCNGSDSCILTASENEITTLTCYIDGIRPAAKLYWKYEGALIIIHNRSYSEPSDAVSDTWNSSATLQYTLPCGEDAVMYCRSNERNITTKDVNIVSVCSHSATSVNISQKTSNKICQRKPHLCLITFGTLSGFFCIVGIYFIFSRRKSNKEETAGTMQYESLMKNLKTLYTDRFIPKTEILYTSCEVVNQYPDQNSDFSISDEIFKRSFLLKNNRILLIGASGYGKTFCFQQLLSKWIKGDAMHSVLVIYLQLRFLSPDSNILREITTMLTETSISVQTLNALLKSEESLILLDGLDYLNRDLDCKQRFANDALGDKMNNCSLTVNDLLGNDIASFPKMNVWVSSGILNYGEIFQGPLTLVNMRGLNKKQRNQLLALTTKHYLGTVKNNGCNGELGDEEEDLQLPRRLEELEGAWNISYRSTGNDNASPLVVYLFALNFLRKSEKTLMIPNSTSHKEVSWDEKKFTVDLSQIDWYLLACLFKSCVQDKWKRTQFKSLFRGYDMIFEKGTDSYNINAMTEICFICRKFDVELDTLTFWKEYPPALIEYLPKVTKMIIFKEIALGKREFITLINTLTKGVPTLSFVDCDIPEDLTKEEFTEEINTSGMANKSGEVFRERGEETYLFGFEDATWTKQTREETMISDTR